MRADRLIGLRRVAAGVLFAATAVSMTSFAAPDVPPPAPPADAPMRQAAIALGFVIVLAGLGLLLVRYRGGRLGLPRTADARMSVLEVRRSGSLQLTLARVDSREFLIVQGPSGISTTPLEAQR